MNRLTDPVLKGNTSSMFFAFYRSLPREWQGISFYRSTEDEVPYTFVSTAIWQHGIVGWNKQTSRLIRGRGKGKLRCRWATSSAMMAISAELLVGMLALPAIAAGFLLPALANQALDQRRNRRRRRSAIRGPNPPQPRRNSEGIGPHELTIERREWEIGREIDRWRDGSRDVDGSSASLIWFRLCLPLPWSGDDCRWCGSHVEGKNPIHKQLSGLYSTVLEKVFFLPDK